MTTPLTIESKAKEPSGLKLVFVLALAGLLSGLTIVGAYEVTLPIITANNQRALERAVFKVVPGSEKLQGLIVAEGSAEPAGEDSDERPSVYAAYDADGRFVGYAIACEGPGFQDTIRLLYGYDPTTRRITGMEVLESRETPGLGDKIYKDAHFRANFEALAVDPQIVVVKKGEKTQDNQVDAITGATISSKAVVKILNTSNGRWLDIVPSADDVPALEAEGGE
jgi:electron transport complex protein RnfG